MDEKFLHHNQQKPSHLSYEGHDMNANNGSSADEEGTANYAMKEIRRKRKEE